MNKKSVFLTLALLFLSIGMTTTCEAKSKLRSSNFTIDVYYAAQGWLGDAEFYTTVATPGGVYYGVYDVPSMLVAGQVFPNISWTGPGSAPVWKLVSKDNSVNSSHCPGMPSGTGFDCILLRINIILESDDYGCPWVSSTYALSGIATGFNYHGPSQRYTVCPTVPVDTYDISWSPDYVQHEKTLSLASTGDTITTVLPTYLMESGELCDGSQYDSRGAYCRFVATGVSLSVLGCSGDAPTTATATAHPITDRELHDISVAVNTKNIGSGTAKSVCSFQYLIDEL